MMAQWRPLEHRRCSSDKHCRIDTRRRGRPSVEKRNGQLGENGWTASGCWSPGGTVDLAFDEGRSRQGAGRIFGTCPRARQQCRRRQLTRRRGDEDRVQRGHHALRILDVGRLVTAELGHGLERSVRLRVAVREQAVMAGLVHRVMNMRRRGQRQQAERGYQHGAQSPERCHVRAAYPLVQAGATE